MPKIIITMNVNSVADLSSYLPQLATSSKSDQVQGQIQVAVLKSIMNQQKSAGEDVVEMIQASSISPELGQNIDLRA